MSQEKMQISHDQRQRIRFKIHQEMQYWQEADGNKDHQKTVNSPLT